MYGKVLCKQILTSHLCGSTGCRMHIKGSREVPHLKRALFKGTYESLWGWHFLRMVYFRERETLTSNLSRKFVYTSKVRKLRKYYIIYILLTIYVYIYVDIQENIQHLSTVYIFKLCLVGGINQFFQFHGARMYSTRSSRRLVTIWSYDSNVRLLHLRWSIATVDLPG